MKIITILDHTEGTIYYYNISKHYLNNIDNFILNKNLDLSNCSYMITKDLTVFDNRINK